MAEPTQKPKRGKAATSANRKAPAKSAKAKTGASGKTLKDSTPKPRPSRGKSGKPQAAPVETAAGTPGFGEAPQAAFTASGPLGANALPDPSQYGSVEAAPLPALRQSGPRPPMGGESLTASLNAMLARPEQRCRTARAA
jgi:excinuclease ABC subunit B